MSIVLDARGVGPELSGIGRYTLGLLSGLAELDPPGPIYVLGRHVDLLDKVIGESRGIEIVACNLPPWSIRSQLRLPGRLKKLGCTVYHCPYVYAPIMARGLAQIVTVHDLIPTRCPDLLRKSWKVRLAPIWNAWFQAQCARADAIVTVSDFSKQDLLHSANVPPHMVYRIYNGVRLSNTTWTEQDVRRRFGITGQIISYIGRHDPYKNLDGLVQAFNHVCERSREELTLVIAGRIDSRYPQAQQRMESLRLKDRVIFTDYIDEDVRVALLRASCVFVFPSRYEGFGLPALEAMAEGVPVVASNVTCLPEVLGEAALLVDPEDPTAMGEAIASILRDGTLAQKMSAAGRRRAAQFTWEDCAVHHLQLYKLLAG